MGTVGGALRALSPHSLLRLYLAVVVCTAVVAIGAVLLTSSRVDSRSRAAASQSNAAIADSQIQASLREPLMVLLTNTYNFLLNSEAFTQLPADQRLRVLSAVADGFAQPGSSIEPLPNVPVPISERDAITLQRAVDVTGVQIGELVAGARGVDMTQVQANHARMRQALESYLDDNSANHFRDMLTSTIALGTSLNVTGDQLSLRVTAEQDAVNSATNTARVVMVLGLLVMASTMAMATYLVSRLITRAFISSETERSALRETTRTLQYRNDQLSALYAVFSEITDTLSMHYVISATLRETLRVMNSTMVVLRLLQGSELVVVGNMTDAGREVPNMGPVPLGEGPTGRVARRGRSMRIGHGAQSLLGPSTDPEDPNSGVESGIIVPLIVGARVVGTLACWSRQPDAYSEDDEKVLEMMASQVATAVVAADHAETSERRAMHDPLTGLPNRRQLTEDITSQFSGLAEVGQRAAIAMIDVDHFKRLNDDFGHRVGDVSLQKIASVMRNAMREGDMIYRYGGEEFVAIFKGASGPESLAAADRLRHAVETTPLTGDQLEPVGPVTISIGLALFPDHDTDVNALIEMADKAMYRAKEFGRNRVEVWQEETIAGGATSAA
ncbi:MAG TPA: sensor domain-containing diguanylate cyclase [Dehalococcoidia bacterium]|nr:sensor domain-containing diguanylate cyclase [Dehalococcoidia bacterium]